jgi:glyoxylase-like metal-dependent hydrolase (beta-lactamase superfamily II)
MQWAVIAALAVVISMPAQAQQRTGLAAAADAMGAAGLNSIQYAGTGLMYGFGQAYEPGGRWPRFIQNSYTMAINYQTPAMRLATSRSQGEAPVRGGATQPIAGEQRAIVAASGRYAWQEGGPQATPAPAAVEGRLLQLWTTPHGVIKAAMANSARIEGTTVTFNLDRREIRATLNAQNLVDKVRYLATDSVIGDYPVEISYSDYADFGGVKFPRHIVQTEDGYPTLDVTVSEVKPNAPVAIDAPANVQIASAAPPAAPKIGVDKLGEGIWYLTTPNQRSWAVEFKDFAVVVEGIGDEARSLAVMDEVARLIPNKPIRYVINTHPHYDHAGGLRTYVAKGITVVTQEANKPFFEQVWGRPRTLAPDLLSKSPRPAVFETVHDKKVISDGTRSIELYFMKDTSHNINNLLVYMPAEKLAYWGDGYNPPQGSDPRDPGRTPEQMIDIYRVITMNNLDVKTIAPAHGFGPKPYDDLKKAIGLLPL